jgi:hypothetical protein
MNIFVTNIKHLVIKENKKKKKNSLYGPKNITPKLMHYVIVFKKKYENRNNNAMTLSNWQKIIFNFFFVYFFSVTPLIGFLI